MEHHINPKATKIGIGAALLALVIAVGGFAFSKKTQAEEVQQPDNSARIEVVDKDGNRSCDIYLGAEGNTTRAQMEAYAKEKGCKFKAWIKSVTHKDTPVALEVQEEAPATVAPVSPPKAPSLSVAPAPAAQVAVTK